MNAVTICFSYCLINKAVSANDRQNLARHREGGQRNLCHVAARESRDRCITGKLSPHGDTQ